MLKPSELKKKTFTKAMRGYSIPEVDEYMNFVIEKYTELFRKNFELEQQLRAALEIKNELEGEKDSVRGALVNAQKVASKIIETANERAEGIIDSAKAGCNTILDDFNVQINAERETVLTLKKQVATLKKELFEKYKEHIEMIDKLTSVTESVKLKTNEEYLNDAVVKTQEELARRKEIDTPKVKIDFDMAITTEAPKVTLDPDELFEGGDTVVFERITEHLNNDSDNGDTKIIDTVKADE